MLVKKYLLELPYILYNKVYSLRFLFWWAASCLAASFRCVSPLVAEYKVKKPCAFLDKGSTGLIDWYLLNKYFQSLTVANNDVQSTLQLISLHTGHSVDTVGNLLHSLHFLDASERTSPVAIVALSSAS